MLSSKNSWAAYSKSIQKKPGESVLMRLYGKKVNKKKSVYNKNWYYFLQFRN